MKPGRPSRRGRSRGEAISQGQVRDRAERVKGLTLCAGCGQVVRRRRYCEDCRNYYRKTDAFQQEREKRRKETLLLPAKQRGQRERRPIGFPRKPGAPQEKLDEHYNWLMRKAGGWLNTEIAREAGVTPEAVTLGIQDIESRLPADRWSKVFYERAGSRANAVRDQLYPLQGRVIPAREMPARDERVRRLAALRMPMTLIAAKVGYPEDHVRAVLEKHGVRPADLSFALDDRRRHVRSAPGRELATLNITRTPRSSGGSVRVVRRSRTRRWRRSAASNVGLSHAATTYRSPGRPPRITLDQAREIVAAKRGAVARLARDLGITPAHAHRIRNGRETFWSGKLLASPPPASDAAAGTPATSA